MSIYKTEEEFLKHYDSSAFEKLSMTSDILLISVSSEEKENYRNDMAEPFKQSPVLIRERKHRIDDLHFYHFVAARRERRTQEYYPHR